MTNLTHTYRLGLFGFVAGLASYFLSAQVFGEVQFTAGVVYGIAIALYAAYFIFQSKFPPQLLLWLAASIGSYYVAVQATARVGGPVPFFIGGIVGSALMLAGFHFFVKNLKLNSYLLLIILGGVLGMSATIDLPINIMGNDDSNLVFVLYLVWQTGMSLGLGYVLDQSETK